MGEVETINPAVTRMFGLQGKDIVGGNISRIIPSPIAEVHNDILERYLVHKTSRIVNYTRMAFGLHASGYIFPVHLYVRWADEGNAKFLGVLQSVPLDNDVHLMLDPARRTVAYATPNAHSLLGLSLRAVAEGAAAADTLIPCLAGDDGEARLEVMRSRLGLETSCRHALTGALSPCRVWCVETPVMGRRVVFLRVVLDTAAEADAGAGWDSECSDQEVVSLADRFADVLEGGPADDGDAGGLSPSLSPSLRGRRGSLASSLASADGSVGAVASCSEVNPVFSGRRAAPRGSGLGLGLGAGLCRVPETEVGAAEAASSPGACVRTEIPTFIVIAVLLLIAHYCSSSYRAPAGPSCSPAPTSPAAGWAPPPPSAAAARTATPRPTPYSSWSRGCPLTHPRARPPPRPPAPHPPPPPPPPWSRARAAARGRSGARCRALRCAGCARRCGRTSGRSRGGSPARGGCSRQW
jgi:PAS domain S-box-containing protein